MEILEKQTKNGSIIRWRIIVEDDTFRTESWYYPDGKVKSTQPTIATPKNVGRENETTPQQQALLEAQSHWNKKIDQGYRPIGTLQQENTRPMLAQDYTRRKHKLTEPFGASPKLDGIRAIATPDGRLLTRNGKPITFLLAIKQQLSALRIPFTLDGEIYSHDIPFQVLSGCVRATKNKSELDSKIEYHIFDIMSDKPYAERMTILKTIEESLTQAPNLKFVYFVPITHDQVQHLHNTFVQRGYEGLICRQLSAPYEHFRSNGLLKYKMFQDSEFVITGATEGVGNEAGAIIFIVETEAKRQFNVRPRGSLDERRRMMANSQQYIGKLLTVRFQELDSITGTPRFSVGIRVADEIDGDGLIRDYE